MIYLIHWISFYQPEDEEEEIDIQENTKNSSENIIGETIHLAISDVVDIMEEVTKLKY